MFSFVKYSLTQYLARDVIAIKPAFAMNTETLFFLLHGYSGYELILRIARLFGCGHRVHVTRNGHGVPSAKVIIDGHHIGETTEDGLSDWFVAGRKSVKVLVIFDDGEPDWQRTYSCEHCTVFECKIKKNYEQP